MKCPFCDCEDSRVVDSRPTEDNSSIRRRRECEKCKKRFTTYERIEMVPLIVVKKGGQRVPFDRNKILNGMVKACEKCCVSIDVLNRITDDIEKKLLSSELSEIPSYYIGEEIMAALKGLDQVAYVRFASVYREFRDVDSFRKELDQLK